MLVVIGAVASVHGAQHRAHRRRSEGGDDLPLSPHTTGQHGQSHVFIFIFIFFLMGLKRSICPPLNPVKSPKCPYVFASFHSNTRDVKLCTKICTKSHMAIHMAMSDNTHYKLYQLKLNDMDYHVYYHMRLV